MWRSLWRCRGCVSCSALRADDAEDKAVAFVEKLGGKVTRDEKAPGKPVITVDLSVTQVTDAGLKELAPLQNLTALDLSYTTGDGRGAEGTGRDSRTSPRST